jgi:hypothetical protein
MNLTCSCCGKLLLVRGRIPSVEVIGIVLGPIDADPDFVASMHLKIGRYDFDSIEFFRDDDGTVVRSFPERTDFRGRTHRTYPLEDELLAFAGAAAWAVYEEECRKQGREPEGGDG